MYYGTVMLYCINNLSFRLSFLLVPCSSLFLAWVLVVFRICSSTVVWMVMTVLSSVDGVAFAVVDYENPEKAFRQLPSRPNPRNANSCLPRNTVLPFDRSG